MAQALPLSPQLIVEFAARLNSARASQQLMVAHGCGGGKALPSTWQERCALPCSSPCTQESPWTLLRAAALLLACCGTNVAFSRSNRPREAGHPILVTNDGETPLTPGMCAGFKAGTGNAHQLLNRSTEDVLYLEVGDRTVGDSATYPDEDLQALAGNDGKLQYPHKDGTPY